MNYTILLPPTISPERYDPMQFDSPIVHVQGSIIMTYIAELVRQVSSPF